MSKTPESFEVLLKLISEESLNALTGGLWFDERYKRFMEDMFIALAILAVRSQMDSFSLDEGKMALDIVAKACNRIIDARDGHDNLQNKDNVPGVWANTKYSRILDRFAASTQAFAERAAAGKLSKQVMAKALQDDIKMWRLLWDAVKMHDNNFFRSTAKDESKMERPEWWKVSEVEELTGINKGVISKNADSGKLQSNGKKGRDRRISLVGLVKWLESRQEPEKIKELMGRLPVYKHEL